MKLVDHQRNFESEGLLLSKYRHLITKAQVAN